LGAAIGALAGAAGGLLGAAFKSSEAAEAQERAANALRLAAEKANYGTRDVFNSFVNGNDPIKAITDRSTELYSRMSAAIDPITKQLIFTEEELQASEAGT